MYRVKYEHKVLIKIFLQKALHENIYNCAFRWTEKIPPSYIIVLVIYSHDQWWIVHVFNSPTCHQRSGVQYLSENTLT